MKKAITFLMLFALMTTLFAGCAAEPQQQEAQQIVTIGILEPFTGANSAGGKQEALGMMYANSLQPTVEVGGVTYKVEFAVGDTESSKEKAPTAAESLVKQNPAVILGCNVSDEAIAASPIFEAAGIPAIGVTCTNPAVTAGNQHYFRICWLDTFQGSVLANFAREHLTSQKVYCLAERNDQYSAGLCSYFVESFTALGGTVVYETFPEGTTDFTPYIQAAKREGADTFFAPVTTQNAAGIIDQAAAEALDMPILAGDSWDFNVVAAAGMNKNVDIYITTFFDENTQTEQGKAFVKGFQEYLNSNEQILAQNGGNDMVSANSVMGYDAYFVALEAMKKAGSIEPEAVQEALRETTYAGVAGDISFDPETGDAIRTTAYVKQVNKDFGTWNFVTVQELD